MGMYFYNNVLLPEISSNIRDEYQLFIITKMEVTEDGNTMSGYELHAFTDVNGETYDAFEIQEQEGTSFIKVTVDAKKYANYVYMEGETDDWTYSSGMESVTPSDPAIILYNVPGEVVRSLLWSDTDILKTVPDGDGTYSIVTYLEGTEPKAYGEKEYSIKESTLIAIGDSIRAQSGKTEQINPLDMPKEIDDLKLNLQERTFYQNGEYGPSDGYDAFAKVTIKVEPRLQEKTVHYNGTYTPDEDCYGLSKVVVETLVHESVEGVGF